MSLSFSTEGLARNSARHPWRTIGFWAGALVVAIMLIGAFLASALTTNEGFTNSPESKRGD